MRAGYPAGVQMRPSHERRETYGGAPKAVQRGRCPLWSPILPWRVVARLTLPAELMTRELGPMAEEIGHLVASELTTGRQRDHPFLSYLFFTHGT